MRPIFIIEQNDRDDGDIEVGLSFEQGSEPAIIEALYRAAKEYESLYGIIESVHSKLKMTSFGYGGFDSAEPKNLN